MVTPSPPPPPPPPPPRNGLLFGLTAVLLASLGVACIDDDLTEAPVSPADAGASLSNEELGESPFQLALAREIPGFGGVFYEPGEERLVVAVTEAGRDELPAARRAVGEAMNQLGPLAGAPEVLGRVVEYSFLELATHRARLRPYLFELPEWVSLGVDEEFNRIRVGVTDLAVRSAVMEIAAQLEVPDAMLNIVRESPTERRIAIADESPPSRAEALPLPWPRKLNDRIPDRVLAGGYEAAAEFGDGACSIGFTAVLKQWPVTKVFVSASHCTVKLFRADEEDDDDLPGDWIQPEDPHPRNLVGSELLDPETWRCGFFWLFRCRNSDAALIEVDVDHADIAIGKIARTRTRQRYCELLSCDRLINQDNPTFTITTDFWVVLDNMMLDKVGQKTGWTYGWATETCTDILADEGVVMKCNHVTSLLSRGGDSGAPVFWIADPYLRLVGIMWGGPVGEYRTTYISSLDQIRKDLGDFHTHNVGAPPHIWEIQGPRRPLIGLRCRWFADAWEGKGPLKYEWSGYASGIRNPLVAQASSTRGWLKVKVTDLWGRSDQDSIYITPVPPADRQWQCPSH